MEPLKTEGIEGDYSPNVNLLKPKKQNLTSQILGAPTTTFSQLSKRCPTMLAAKTHDKQGHLSPLGSSSELSHTLP